jgi:glutathione S-transferase
MSLVLYYHPLASFCHKVLIALYENETPFEPRIVDLGSADSSAELRAHWPVGKIPVLHDRAKQRTIPETTIIIEYLARHHPGPLALIPDDPDAALDARLWDRFFDNYVQVPMGKFVTDRLRAEGRHDPQGVEEAVATLKIAYGMLERQLEGKRWATGETFSIADCTAAPALFYAQTIVPFGAGHPRLRAYFDRLSERPSVIRVIDEARPYFDNYPLRDAIPARFRRPAAEGR